MEILVKLSFRILEYWSKIETKKYQSWFCHRYKNQDSKFDRKKKGKKKKIVKIKEESSIEKNDKTEETITSSKSEETEALAEAATVTEVKKEENPVLKSNTETIVIPQKTQSIFFKHLPVNVTRQDLEEVCLINLS